MHTANNMKQRHTGRLAIGQAGVFRVASELLMRGHVPSFPSVDTGCDILLDNGIRIQVKSRQLQAHPAYPEGCYPFSTEQAWYKGKAMERDWASIVDFFVFVGITEWRFFIAPVSMCSKNFWIRPRGLTQHCVSVDAMRSLRDKGMTYQAIAEQLGVNDMTVIRNLRKPSKLNSPGGNRHLASFEDRWDLLDVNRVVSEIGAAADAVSAESSEV